jgi:hypothetical protein
MQIIGTLWHAFEVATIEKEVALEEAFNAKIEGMCWKNDLRKAQMQVWLTI